MVLGGYTTHAKRGRSTRQFEFDKGVYIGVVNSKTGAMKIFRDFDAGNDPSWVIFSGDKCVLDRMELRCSREAKEESMSRLAVVFMRKGRFLSKVILHVLTIASQI